MDRPSVRDNNQNQTSPLLVSSNLRPDLVKGAQLSSAAPAAKPADATQAPASGDTAADDTEHTTPVDPTFRTLAHQHYIVSASIGASEFISHPTEVVIDTGAAFNVIRRDALPADWQAHITGNTNLPALGDASGNLLSATHEVLLRVRFANAVYRIPFVVVEKLTCPVLVGTQFLNEHVRAIRCIEQRIEFTQDTIPILGSGSRHTPWRDLRQRLAARVHLTSDDNQADDNTVTTVSRIRLTRAITLAPMSQTKAQVTTQLEGLIITEPKGDLATKRKVRVMNSVHDTRADQPFTIILSNFAKHPRQ